MALILLNISVYEFLDIQGKKESEWIQNGLNGGHVSQSELG